LFVLAIYITTSCILCIIADRTLPLHNLRKSNIFRATDLENEASQDISAALFGHSLEEVGITAADPVKVYHTKDSMCTYKPTDFTVPKPTSSDHDPIAILMPRGGCSFGEKAEHVVEWYQRENPNIKVVFVYDFPDKPHDSLIKMDIDEQPDEERKKLSVCLFSISYKSAMSLLKSTIGPFEQASPVRIVSDKFQPQGGPPYKLRTMAYELIASVIITIFSFLITAAVLVLRWGNSFSIEISREGLLISYLGGEDDHIDTTELLSEEQVMALPEFKYDASFDEENPSSEELKIMEMKKMCNSTCSICIDDFEKDEMLRVLPCGHMYHTECILPWLTTRAPNCPMCKDNIDNTDKTEKKKC